MANVVLQRGEAWCCDDGRHYTTTWKSKNFVFFLLSAMLGSNSFKSLQGFLYLVLCFYTREREKKKTCSSTLGYVNPHLVSLFPAPLFPTLLVGKGVPA